MKKLNRKGFTLIELLAVIVLLAVVLAVTIPNVLKSMRSARLTQLHNLAVSVAKWYDEAAESDSLDLGNSILGDAKITDNGWHKLDKIARIYGLSNEDIYYNNSSSDFEFKVDNSGKITLANNKNLEDMNSLIRINENGKAEVLLIATDNGKFDTNGTDMTYAFSFGTTGYDSVVGLKKTAIIGINKLTEEKKQAYVDTMAEDIMHWYIDIFISDNQDPLSASDEIYLDEDNYLTTELFLFFPNYDGVLDVNASYIYKTTVNGKTRYCLDVESIASSKYGNKYGTECYTFR